MGFEGILPIVAQSIIPFRLLRIFWSFLW